MTSARILIVEDSASLAMTYSAHLVEDGYLVEVADTGAAALAQIDSGPGFNVILLDLQLPDMNGLDILKAREEKLTDTSVIVITADGSLNRAIEAMRLGAYDFLVKPANKERLATTVRNAAERHRLAREVKAVRKSGSRNSFQGFIGKSAVMQAVYRAIENIADSKASVFITGESGSGKELAAEAIHLSGRRSGKPFVAINCGAIPENLLESELFGHVKGAFTGALENRIGAAKAADGGTLFLDEICEMELKLQVKLLRFLQTGMIQRVGTSTPEPVDVRVICATNRDPVAEVSQGNFREDLYYRLNVIPLELPPLRDRGEDVIQIAEIFMDRFAKEEGREISGLSDKSRQYLRTHAWPGNVRELQNSVRRAIVVGSGETLELIAAARPSPPGSVAQSPMPLPTATGPAHASSSSSEEGVLVAEDWTMEDVEKAVMRKRIDAHGGNVVQAARTLGISPSTIYRKLEKWQF